MFQVLQPIVEFFQPALVPICCITAWGIVMLMGWSLWTAVRDTTARSQQMHRIPCSNCQFFTADYHLKCTVHPSQALTEAAIECPDFHSRPTIL